MRKHALAFLVVLLAAIACSYPGVATPSPTSTLVPSPTPTPALMPTLPPVAGPEPSYRVGVFYYPWYRTPETDGYWDHWGEGSFHPPLDIASDYYPSLGAYSVADPAVLAQHFAWLREAGVGVIVSSWWGQASREDQAVPLLLDVAEQYGIQVAFHIEPYHGRTAERLVSDVRYLYSRYGDHPAFCRTTASSRWSPDDRAKGLFFVWAIVVPDHDSPEVDAGYWRDAVDAIHDLPDGGLVIANTLQSDWVDGGHFDGLYNYATLHLAQEGGFSWARGLPPEAWYVPSVLPGFSARRIGYAADAYTPRQDGATYAEQWAAALDVGVEPALVTITSFNEWHEGSQIEPAAVGASNGFAYTYQNYGTLPPEGYLALTRQWVDRFDETAWPDTVRARVRLTTSSDWTVLVLVDGAAWLRPDLVQVSEEVSEARVEGDRLMLSQPLTRAEAGGAVEMVVDLLLAGMEEGATLVLEIERGHLGSTQVELANYTQDEPVVVETFAWGGINPGERNATTVQVPAALLLAPAP